MKSTGILKNLKSAQIFALAFAITCSSAVPVFSQGTLQTWNLNAREQSRKLCSSALNFLNKGQLDQAANLLVRASETDPTDALPLETLGLTYLRQGKGSQALDTLKKAYDLLKDPETLLSTGFAYYLEHDFDAAINSWNKALEKSPKQMVDALGDIGFAYLRKGEFERADTSFRALLRTKPNSQLAYQGLATLNYLAGNFSAARKAAEHAQSIQSYFPVILLLAKLDYLQGDPSTGQKRVREWQIASTARGSKKQSLQRSMTVLGFPGQHDFRWDPFLSDNFDNGRFLLARTQAAKTPNTSQKRSSKTSTSKNLKAQDALRQAQSALDASPNDFFILRELALIETSNGDYQQAADHFAQVLRLCPSCNVDWLHLGRALAAAGKESEAAYAVQEFQRKHPTERIAPGFASLGKGPGSNIPELSPTQTPLPKQKPANENETGF